MVENTLDDETGVRGFGVKLLRESRGTLGDHELVTAPKYCGKWLVDDNKWQRVKQTYQKQICNNQSRYCNHFTRRHCRYNNVIFLFDECYETNVIDADT